MDNFSPEKKNSLDATWVLEEHLTELFAELFRSQFILEQKIKLLETEIDLLGQKIDSAIGR